jgi:colicin import membrane protein
MKPKAKSRIAPSAPGSQSGVRPRSFAFWIGCSVLLHLSLLAAVVIVPELAPAQRIGPSEVISVSLVSLPADRPAPAPAAPAARPAAPKPAVEEKPVVQKPQPKPKPEPAKETVSLKPEAKPQSKVKRSLKRETFNPTKVLENTISSLEKKVEENRHPSLEDTLNRLKREVEETDRNPRAARPTGNPDRSAGRAGGRSGTAGLGSAEMQDRIRLYQAEIAYKIQHNWAFAEQLAGGRTDLEVALGIKILPDGEIEEIWFDQRSGNRHLDESAYRAIQKSSPLPPLPPDLFSKHYIVGLRFGPRGIK